MKRVQENVPTVAENEHVKVKIYEDDGGEPHVHFVDGDGNDCKVSLLTFKVVRNWGYDKKTLQGFIKYVFENEAYLRRKWRMMRRRHYAEKK